jgi:lipopolysaccharide/colanic/teichoic acid biosynthesis glycosyltransferase
LEAIPIQNVSPVPESGGGASTSITPDFRPATAWVEQPLPLTDRSAYLAAKRVIDIVVSASALIVFAPLMIAIATYVRWKARGPALFRQIRVGRDWRTSPTLRIHSFFRDSKTGRLLPERRSGAPAPDHVARNRRNQGGQRFYLCPVRRVLSEDRRRVEGYGRPFVFYKFATMYPDARTKFPGLYAYTYSTAELKTLRFKVPDDPRVPPWAAWLRKSSLDELPNFLNVLRGEMSLVGPRPDIPEMVRYYTPEQHRRKLQVKPGMTGIAQIRGRGDLSFQDTLACDLEYVANRTLLLDVKILWLTFLKLFKGREGAY